MISNINNIKINKDFKAIELVNKSDYGIIITNKVLPDTSEQELQLAKIISDDELNGRFVLIDETFIVFRFKKNIACISNHGLICGFDIDEKICVKLNDEDVVIKKDFVNDDLYLLNELVQNNLVILGYDKHKLLAFGHSSSTTKHIITDNGDFYIGEEKDIIFESQ